MSRLVRIPLLLTVLAVALALALGASSPARAAGTPDVTLAVDAPADVLFGTQAPVTLRVANPAGPTGYNVSFRVVLPAGVSYVGGSAPAGLAPRVLADKPATFQTTLIWDNLADLTASSSYELGFRVAHSQTTFDVGDAFTVDAGAYLNTDPRMVPDFDANGLPVAGPTSYTGSATGSATTSITAIEVTKAEPSPEGELMRGVHDWRTVYTLTVRNNAVNPTTGVVVEDWLPAGLEFMGCGVGDNTAEAPTNPGSAREYPGAPALNAGGSIGVCTAPGLVETVQTDPDGAGPLPLAVYTHVRWDGVGDLAAGQTTTLRYAAGVPLRANTTTWPSGEPAATGAQGSNLDNNSGPETTDEQALVNLATATGDYMETPVADTGTLTRTAEDLRLLKSASTSTLAVGGITTWTLDITTSEYRYSSSLVVTDTLPDGLCPRDTAACDPGAGSPSVPYTSAAENADGTWTLVWDRTAAGPQAPSTTSTITFQSRTLAAYRQGFADAGPVLAGDSVRNAVGITGVSRSRCAAPADPTCAGGGTPIWPGDAAGTAVTDASSAGQAGGGPSIAKQVAVRAEPQDCATSAYTDGPEAGYGPGDLVCWKLRIDFPAALTTGTVNVADFLPPGFTYVSGSAVQTASDTVPDGQVAFDPAGPSWSLGDVAPGLVFEWRLASTIDDPAAGANADITSNLMKVSYVNTAGTSFPLRDLADVEWTEPVVTLRKGVAQVDGQPVTPNPPNTDHVAVQAGQTVTWRVDLGNTGGRDATDVVVWDPLPATVTSCAVVADISAGGVCDDANRRITWTVAALAVGGSATLTWDMPVPADLAPGQTITNTAGVRTYVTTGNTGTPVTLIPANNIDNTLTQPNAPSARDPSDVYTRAAALTKTRTTSIVDGSFNTAVQATIGETITWTFTFTVPEGTTLYGDPAVTDPVGTRTTYLGNLTAAMNGGALPAGVTATQASGVVRLGFPATYANPAGSGDDVFTVSFDVRLDDAYPQNQRGGTATDHTVPNTATAAWKDQGAADRSATGSTSVEVVEPDIRVAKSSDDADGDVDPGQSVAYTLTVTNPSGTRVSRGYDVVLTDLLPPGVTLTDAGSGAYTAGTRTLRWTDVPDLAPGATAVRTYRVTIDSPATARTFTNDAAVTTTSMPGAATGERTSTSPGDPPGYRDADALTLDLLVPALAVAKTTGLPGAPEQGPAEAGRAFPWRVVVRNTGTASAYGVRIADTLPPGWAYAAGSAVLSQGGAQDPVVVAQATGDGLTWAVPGAVAPEASVTLTFDAVPGPAAIAATGIGPAHPHTNVASVTGTDVSGATRGPDGPYAGGPDPATAILSGAVLTIRKTPDGQAVVPGQTALFSLLVTNTGDRTATGVHVVDVLPPGLAYVPGTATTDDGVVTEAAPVTGPGGSVTLDLALADVPPGGTRWVSIPVVVASPLDDGTPLVNTATVTSPLTPPATDPGSLVVTSGAALALAKSADRATVAAGDTLTYTLRVTVAGTADARDVVVRDPLPAGLDLVSASDGGALEGGDVVWRLGRRAPGTTQVLTLATRVRAVAAGGEIRNTATASATGLPPVSAGAVVTGPPVPGPASRGRPPELVLGIGGPGVLVGGQQGTWVITLGNHGGRDARGVVVRKPLACGLALVRSDPPAQVRGGMLVWRVPRVPAGGRVRIRVVLRATGSSARACRVRAATGARGATAPLRIVARPRPRRVAVTG